MSRISRGAYIFTTPCDLDRIRIWKNLETMLDEKSLGLWRVEGWLERRIRILD